MKRVVLASANPVKLRATRAGFERVFRNEVILIESVLVPSDVRAQPLTDQETLQGARNRARAAARLRLDADFWVGIEGGVAEVEGAMQSFSWVYVCSAGAEGQSRTATFLLPPTIAVMVRSGSELGEACDRTFGQVNTSRSDGAVGLLTGGLIDRTELYEPAVVLAMVPLRNLHLFPGFPSASAPPAP